MTRTTNRVLADIAVEIHKHIAPENRARILALIVELLERAEGPSRPTKADWYDGKGDPLFP